MGDFGRRVRAARAHAGISRETLAASLTFPAERLERLEAGLDEPTEDKMLVVVKELADATRLPEQFFTGDFDSMEPS
jgi:ribosome-binding protein aMBF1 (putative translation factor)